MLPSELSAIADLRQKWAGAFSESERLLNAAIDVVLPEGKALRGAEGHSEWSAKTVIILFAKAAKTFRSVEIVAANGLGQDALTLCRSLYETAAVIEFILSGDPIERAAMYHAHCLERFVVSQNARKGTPALRDGSEDAAIVAAQSLIARYAPFYPAGTNVRDHWSGHPSLYSASSTVLNQHEMYQSMYRDLSSHVHATDFGEHGVTDAGEGAC